MFLPHLPWLAMIDAKVLPEGLVELAYRTAESYEFQMECIHIYWKQ